MLRIILTVTACLASPVLAAPLVMLAAMLAEWINPDQPALHIHNVGVLWIPVTLLLMVALIALIRRFLPKPNSN
jgi:hypothetical protein